MADSSSIPSRDSRRSPALTAAKRLAFVVVMILVLASPTVILSLVG